MANDEEGGTDKSSFVSANLPKIIAVLVILLLIGSLAGWKFMHWMEEDEQCGGICHNHQEYYDVYQGTIHQQAGVMCKECHVKEGLTGFIKSQIGNTGNLYKYYIKGGVYKGDFSGIMAHVDEREWLNKAAPMETCQRSGCHSNNKFITTGKTRGYEFDESMFVAAGAQSQRSPEDEPKGTLVSESTNDKNTQGVLSFHQLHIQAPTEAEASWVSFGFRGKSGDTFVKPHCQDCHGNVMTGEVPVYDDDYVEQEEWTLTYEGSLPAPGRGAWTGGTRQKVPIDMCLSCHDGDKAPGIYGNVGGDFPTDLPS